MTESEAERDEIECELQRLRFKHPLPFEPHISEYHERIAELTRRLQALPRPLQHPTGLEAGSILVGVDRLLGSIPPPDLGSVPETGHHSCSLDYGGAYPWADEES